MRRVQVTQTGWAVFVVLSLKTKMRYSKKSDANLRGWKPNDSWEKVAATTLTDWGNWNVMAPLLLETAKSHRKLESKEMSVTELGLKSLLLRKERDGRQLGRTQERSNERNTSPRSRRVQRRGKPPTNHKASISTGIRLRNRKTLKKFSQTSSKTSIQSPLTKKTSPNPRDSTGQNSGRT